MTTVATVARPTTSCADVVSYVRKGNILSVYGIKGPRGGTFLRLVKQLRRHREVPCQIWVGASPVPPQDRAWLAAVLTSMQHTHDCPQRYAFAGLLTIAGAIHNLRTPFTCTFDYGTSLGVIRPARQ